MKLIIIGNVPSKKNSKQIIYVRGKPIIISSKAFTAWHKDALEQLTGHCPAHCHQIVALTFYPSTRRRADLTNKAESIMDLLVDAGIIPDDNWFEVPEVPLKFGGVDKINPRCEITIT